MRQMLLEVVAAVLAVEAVASTRLLDLLTVAFDGTLLPPGVFEEFSLPADFGRGGSETRPAVADALPAVSEDQSHEVSLLVLPP